MDRLGFSRGQRFADGVERSFQQGLSDAELRVKFAVRPRFERNDRAFLAHAERTVLDNRSGDEEVRRRVAVRQPASGDGRVEGRPEYEEGGEKKPRRAAAILF